MFLCSEIYANNDIYLGGTLEDDNACTNSIPPSARR